MDKEEKMQQVINEISKHALGIHNLMTPGTTVTISITEPRTIIVPNDTPAEKKYLIISRPTIMMSLDVKPI